MRKDTIRNIFTIVRCIAQAGNWIWYREISRRTKLHHKTVARLVEGHLSMFVDTQSMEPFQVKMVRLKAGVDIDKVARFLSMKERLEK